MVQVFCGIDWAEGHHDVALVDEAGQLVAKKRIKESVEGFTLVELLAAAGDSADAPIPVGIETPRGLVVAALRETGRPVFAINPMAVARYRERHSVSRAKSDHADAMVLANILRTDRHVHRVLPADSELARAIAVLARAHQDATWQRTRAVQELRSVLRECYPSFLEAFAGSTTNLATPSARAVLAIASTPADGARLTKAQIAAALRRAGRRRGIDTAATDLKQALRQPQLRQPQLRQPPRVEQAMGVQALALLAVVNTACDNVDRLAEAVTAALQQHPDYQILVSFPGLSETGAARVLAEIGDDRARFSDARALKAYSGSAPLTRASGRSISITHRRIKNDRLAAAGFVWSFMSITNHPPARAHYDQRRDRGDRHPGALRHLFNRLLGQLHHCLRTGQFYDPTKAFGDPLTAA
ncbi:IS110 family transposase [Actinoplanes sp. NEAU-A12]|uniref:IS110 family transposase n=1 Tax=Actinoplanes sandaracinus TaxID=3045177 RepID=A0ABT6X1C2_9ACTN|nr:IS110 family transposase [Actinoplanes sandaracinus]MDI6105788.1 IS110 family transposase [Actinoplanes sandaracinus]